MQKVIQKPAFHVIGYEIETNSDRADAEISELWHKFIAENSIDLIPNKSSFDFIALYSNYHKGVLAEDQESYVDKDTKKSYSYLVGCMVDAIEKVPTGMTARTVPAGKYAHFTSSGDFPKSLLHTWKQIDKMDLSRTHTYDFEIYGAGFQCQYHEVDIFVSIA